MSNTIFLGLDLGGTKIAAGVVARGEKLLSSIRLATPARGVAHDVAALFDAAQSAVAIAGVPWKKIRGIGVGVPGAFDPRGRTVWAPNLPGWRKVPLERLLTTAFARPIFIEGDRNVQALAEFWTESNSQSRVQSLVFVTLGTGIGAGLVLGGRLVSGKGGVAGAAGWLATSETWRPEFARMGCLEASAAGPALARRAEKALRRNPTPVLKSLAGSRGIIDAEIVASAAREGDPVACRVLHEAGTDLGRGVASIVSLLNPDVVVIGGGLAASGDALLRPLREAVRRWSQPLAWRQVRIRRSRLGDDAGILGAARFAMLKLEEKI